MGSATPGRWFEDVRKAPEPARRRPQEMGEANVVVTVHDPGLLWVENDG